MGTVLHIRASNNACVDLFEAWQYTGNYIIQSHECLKHLYSDYLNRNIDSFEQFMLKSIEYIIKTGIKKMSRLNGTQINTILHSIKKEHITFTIT